MALVVALAALLLLGVVNSGRSAKDAGSAPQPVNAVPLGAFLGPGQDGVNAIDDFEKWLGTAVAVGRAYLPGHSWRDIEGPDWVLDPWSAWRKARSDRMLVLNVPMIAPNEPPLGDGATAELLRRGAAGAFDPHFRTLAERLVARDAGDTIIVLGWEMNGTTYSGRCAPEPSAWREYWRRVVAVMRSVPGQRFRFDFTPVRGPQAVSWQRCYPGDDVVDIIGMDSYDQRPGTNFSDFVHQPDGLQAQADFAAAHRKPLSYPEWGLFDFGDNPGFVRDMYAWISAHNVAYQSITDYCPHGVWQCQEFPASGRAYRELFGLIPTTPPRGR